ncbi:MAG: ZZ-type protein [Acidobacteriota bacterium]|nr:ZZ-type protein [Acidobacteriota bacterium]
MIHVWNHCHNCNAAPIVGRRFHCESCPDGPDNDLCESCYEKFREGKIIHPAEDSSAALLEIKEHRFKVEEGKPEDQYETWLSVGHPTVSAPRTPDYFVVRPIFSSQMDSVIGGYAFVATVEKNGKPLMLTALHVMDELIKKKGIDCSEKNKNYTGRELPAIITHVDIYDIFASNWMMTPVGSAGPMLVLPDARTDGEEPYSDRDIAAFWIKDASNLNPVPLAGQPPVKGAPVWQAARSPKKPVQHLFKAVVVESTDRTLVFKYEDPGEKAKYTSGSPVLNKNGEIVGISVGGGEYKGTLLGHANHVGNIRKHLTGNTF